MSIHIRKMRSDELIFERITIGNAYEPIAIDRLKNYLILTGHNIIQLPIERSVAEKFVKLRGIEKHRLLGLTPEYLFKPMLFVEDMRTLSADGGYLDCWDGHHRYVRLCIEGYTSGKAWIVKPVIWRQYIIEGMKPRTPEDILRSRSGL